MFQVLSTLCLVLYLIFYSIFIFLMFNIFLDLYISQILILDTSIYQLLQLVVSLQSIVFNQMMVAFAVPAFFNFICYHLSIVVLNSTFSCSVLLRKSFLVPLKSSLFSCIRLRGDGLILNSLIYLKLIFRQIDRYEKFLFFYMELFSLTSSIC